MISTTSEVNSPCQKTVLENGLRVVTTAISNIRTVSIYLSIGVGSRYESDEQAGISHFIEHLLFKGTNRRPSPVDITSTVEQHGGILNAGTEQESTIYWCKVAEPYFRQSLDLLFDMLTNSLFEPSSIDKERLVVFEELNMVNDYPSVKTETILDQMLWPDHPLGRDIAGTKHSVSDIQRDMMLKHMSDFYIPTNITLSVAGKIKHEEVVKMTQRLSAHLPAGNKPKYLPFTGKQLRSRLHLEYKKTEQAHLAMGFIAIPVTDPDRYALDLVSAILGEGMSSRLFFEVREQKGLAYDIHSSVSNFLDSGAFVITAGVDSKRVYEAVATILEQLALARETISPEELTRAQSLVTGRILLRTEDTGTMAGWAGNQETLLGNVLSVDQVIDEIQRVTLDDINRVAQKVLQPGMLNTVIIGPCRGQARLDRLTSAW